MSDMYVSYLCHLHMQGDVRRRIINNMPDYEDKTNAMATSILSYNPTVLEPGHSLKGILSLGHVVIG